MLRGRRQRRCSARSISPLCQEWEPHGAQATQISSVSRLGCFSGCKNACTWTISTKLAWGTRHQAPCKICRSHNFLNQKPWHPLNFRNQMKVFEAQEQAEKDAKAKAQGKVRRGKHMHLGASKAYWQSAPRIKSSFLMLT